MEIEETAGSEVGAELELRERVDVSSQQTQGIIPKHYNFQEDSSEEDDLVPGQALHVDCDDCVCCVCGENFASFSSLIEHFNLHKDEVCCHLCQLRFSRVISLALHLKHAHPKYNLFCKSCKVMFRNTWHMNQHIEKHSEIFRNGKAVEPDKATKPACSVKPLEEDMEEVVIETQEVEIKEEEEVVVERMQETKANNFIVTTKNDHIFSDHNYCCSQRLKSPIVSDESPAHNTHSNSQADANNVKSINGQTLYVFNNRAYIKDTKESVGDQQEKTELLHSMLKREGMTDGCRAILQAACEKVLMSQNLGKKPSKKQTTHKFSLSSPAPAVVEPVHQDLGIKVEDDDEDNVWDCARIEGGIKGEHEESDSSLLDNLINSPEEDTDTASYLSRDFNSDALKKGSQRLQHKRKRLLTRSIRIRQTCANTSEKLINSVTVGAHPELVSSNEKAFCFGKVRTDLESCSSTEKGSSANVNAGPEPSPAIAKPPNSVKIGSGHVLTFVTTKDDHIFSDHNYCCSQRLKSPIVSDESPAHNTHSNSQADANNVKSINGQTLYVFNNRAYIKDTESVGDQQEKTELLHSMLKREGMTDGCRAILQAACEKVLMSQNLGKKPSKKQTNLKFSLSSPAPAVVEPVHQDLGIKVEDDDKDNVLDCARIEGGIKGEHEESDSSLLDNLINSPGEDTDTASYLSRDFNSDALKKGSQRLQHKRKRLLTRSIRIRQTCANTSEKVINSVTVGAHPELVSSNEKAFCFRKVRTDLESCSSTEKGSSVNAGPEPSPAIAKPPNSVKIGSGHAPSLSFLNPLHFVKASAGSEPSSLKDAQICKSCGLNKAPSEGKPMERCKCTQIFECYMCGVACGRDHLLLKRQTENHLLAKYICSSCLKTFPNQSTFAKQPCTNGPNGQPPSQSSSSVKSAPSMVFKFVPSPNIGISSKETINNGGSGVVSPLKICNILDTSKKFTVLSNSTLPVLSSNSSSAQRVPEQVSAMTTLNANKEATNVVFKGVKDPATPVLMATQAKTGQKPLLIPTSSSASVKPTEVVFQGVVLPQQRPVLADPVGVPVCTTLAVSHSGTSASNQSKVTLRIPIYPSIPNKVKVSFSPTPVQFPTPTHVSASSMKRLPSPSHNPVRPVTAPLLKPVPALATSRAPALVHSAAPAHLQGSSSASSTVLVPPPSEGPLSIVALFVNQSQELALQKRMWQSWRSKAIFLCRHCGAVARQPALVIRHRYLHRGPRLHRCQCGKTFQRQLHLLRHQVQHAEATRYVCAACGQTFQGTQKLACHKQRKLFRVKPSNMKKSIRRECRNAFHCHCGQGFSRPSTLLWHMLKNSRSDKHVKKV